MMIGVRLSVSRMRRQTSNPSSFGSITSSRIRSGCPAAYCASASSPSYASRISYSFRRLNFRISTMFFSSSTIKIVRDM
jgi:hypothetical protein